MKFVVFLQSEKPLDGKLRYGRPLVTPTVFLLLVNNGDAILDQLPGFLFDAN